MTLILLSIKNVYVSTDYDLAMIRVPICSLRHMTYSALLPFYVTAQHGYGGQQRKMYGYNNHPGKGT